MSTTEREMATEEQIKAIEALKKIAPKYSSLDLENNHKKPLLHEFELLKENFDERLEKCKGSLLDTRVLYEDELDIVQKELNSYPILLLLTTNNKGIKEIMSEEDYNVYREVWDFFDFYGSHRELNKYHTFLEIAYNDLKSGSYYFTHSDLQEYTNNVILQHIEENQLVSKLDTLSIPYSKHRFKLEDVLKRFVEQKISTETEAKVLSSLFDFLHSEYSYPKDRTEEVERALEAKIKCCNENSTNDDDEILSRKEVAQLAKVTEETISTWIKTFPDLPYSRRGKSYGFKKREFLSWLYAKNKL